MDEPGGYVDIAGRQERLSAGFTRDSGDRTGSCGRRRTIAAERFHLRTLHEHGILPHPDRKAVESALWTKHPVYRICSGRNGIQSRFQKQLRWASKAEGNPEPADRRRLGYFQSHQHMRLCFTRRLCQDQRPRSHKTRRLFLPLSQRKLSLPGQHTERNISRWRLGQPCQDAWGRQARLCGQSIGNNQ